MISKVSESAVVYRLCMTIFWAFAFIFFVCEFGEMCRNEFDMFNDAIGYCKWYSLPMEIQRMIVILMANSQRSTTIHGCGNISCTRIACKKVNNIH